MSLFDRPPNATDDIHLVASYQKHFDRFLAHLRALNKLLEDYDEHCIGFLHEAAIHVCRQQQAHTINNKKKGTCYEDGIGCALELCVVGTPMPKAIPPFAVCCAALLADDDEWSNPGVLHLLVVDLSDGNSKVLDPLADFERLRLTGDLDSQFPRSDPRRYSRSSLYVSGSCPTLKASGCLVDASANHRVLLRQHQLEASHLQPPRQATEEEPASPPHRAAKFLPYSSTILAGNYTLTRLGADRTLTNEEKKISPGSPGDAAYQKNVAVCGPQGFGFYARGGFRNPLHFLSMITGKKEKVLHLPGHQSAVLSNPRNLEQIITVGPKGTRNLTQLHLVNTAGAEPELVDTIEVAMTEKSGNGFVSTALCCHDADNSIVFVVYGAYTSVVRNVPWLSRDWKRSEARDRSITSLAAAATTTAVYRDLAATDHPLIIAASGPGGVCLLDVRNLNVLTTIYEHKNSVLCSVRASDWLDLQQQQEQEEGTAEN